MPRNLIFLSLLLITPALAQNSIADPKVVDSEFVWFSLAESRTDIAKRLGPPATISDFGEDYQSWQYHIGNNDHHDFSHFLVFRRSTDTLISVTRVYEHEKNVDMFFPPAATTAYLLKTSTYGARVRRLSGDRVLIGMGTTEPGTPTRQLMLIAESALPHFHPWLHVRIKRIKEVRR